ncbi:MAG: FG-GAP-like repeat-containing protein [Candidatus Peregrinibacteria bacterium]|nr:FG-GAP-like repeat-containing protein [Candidatus Peregrinibacteria bacterium]MDZ4244507.1 FG-GAP-like repeat-containing protein [Candidatus Gracilibacteria bacterium]
MGTYKKYLCYIGVISVLIAAIPMTVFAVRDLTFEERNTDIQVKIDEHILESPFGYGQPEATYPTFADLDNDGDMDLFVGTGEGTIIYYQNDGGSRIPNFTLTDRTFLGIDKSQFIMFPTFADTDSDGDLDMYFGEWGNKLSYYKNRGNAEVSDLVFAQGAEATVDVKNFAAPAFVDIDADNDLDLFVGNFDGKISFYENTGSPKVAQYILTSNNYKGLEFNEVAVPRFEDIDSDGDFDLFIGSDNGKIAYYKNTGGPHTPEFELVDAGYFSIEESYIYPAFVDIDGDKDLDLFLGNNLGAMYFYRNEGTIQSPNFKKVTDEYFHLDTGTHSNIDFADLDDDSDVDLFMNNGTGGFYFYENTNTTADPQFELKDKSFINTKEGASQFRFIDIDGDKDLDLVVGYLGLLNSDNGGKLDLYKNIGSVRTPKFLIEEDFFKNIDVGTASAPELYDYDEDGDLDLFVGTDLGTIYFYENTGTKKEANFTFKSNKFEDINVDSHARPRFMDLDRDGDADLLVGNKHGRVFYIENVTGNVGRNFLEVGEITDDLGNYTSIAPLDSNNDGQMDFFVGSANGNIQHFIQTSKNIYPPENVTNLDATINEHGIMTVSWQPSSNSENDLKEYRVYQVTGNGAYTGSTGVGKLTSITLVQPNKYLSYKFKITAVDDSGLQNDGIEIKVSFPNESYEGYVVSKIEKQVQLEANVITEYCAGFPDVKKTDVESSVCDAIGFVKNAGIFSGTAEGKLELDRPINRAEVTKVLSEAFDFTLEVPIDGEFSDVDITQWYAPYIQTAKINGIVEGYADGTFKPEQTINKVELLKVVLEMAETDFSTVDIGQSLYDDIEATAENEWFIKYTNFAHTKELIEVSENSLNPNEAMSRKDVIQLLYRMKETDLAFQ